MSSNIVIVGAGHAGSSAAALLRQYGVQTPITLLGEEPHAPYQRPPLSKAWLKGLATAESLALRPLSYYAEQQIDFRPRTRVQKIDRTNQTLLLQDGSHLPYGQLILATGARAIELPVPGATLAGVLSLRSADDAEALKSRLGPGKRLLIVGGGYIGLEVAASARALGTEVVVLEREPRLLARVAGPVLAEFFQGLHQRQGVQFEFGAQVTGFRGEQEQVCAVQLADGREILCDTALVGIGARPNDELAAEAGLDCARGIVVNAQALSSDPQIFAIGDVSLRPLTRYGRNLRLESVPNALEQAKQVGSVLAGRPLPPEEVPWQWTDQYDTKLQIAGYPWDVDHVVQRGDPASGKFALFHLQGKQIQAIEAVNMPPEFMMGRQLIANRQAVDPDKLANPAVSIKEVST